MEDHEFETLFNHYDESNQGFIDSDAALFALISDMMRRLGGEINAQEVHRVRKAVLAVCDSGLELLYLDLIFIVIHFFCLNYTCTSDGNGRIDKSELELVLKVASQAVRNSDDDDIMEGPNVSSRPSF